MCVCICVCVLVGGGGGRETVAVITVLHTQHSPTLGLGGGSKGRVLKRQTEGQKERET